MRHRNIPQEEQHSKAPEASHFHPGLSVLGYILLTMYPRLVLNLWQYSGNPQLFTSIETTDLNHIGVCPPETTCWHVSPGIVEGPMIHTARFTTEFRDV